MRKLTKIALGAAIFFCISGGILTVAGRVMGGETRLEYHAGNNNFFITPFGLRGMNRGARPNVEVTSGSATGVGAFENLAMDSFTELDVDLAMGDIIVKEGATYGVSLSWSESYGAISCSTEGGVLTITSEQTAWLNMMPGDYHGEAIVYLPKGVKLGQVNLKADLGTVTAQSFSAQQFTVNANLGSAELKDITAAQMDLTLDLGSLTMGRCTAEQLDAQLNLGSMDGFDCNVTEQLTVHSSMGSVNFGGTLECQIDARADMGSVTIGTTLPETDYNYDLRADMGTIYMDGTKQRGEKIQAGKGVYQLDARSDMGDVSVNFSGFIGYDAVAAEAVAAPEMGTAVEEAEPPELAIGVAEDVATQENVVTAAGN